MTVPTTSLSHVRLTVTDIERSRRFYEAVFGWPVAVEMPAGADEATREQFAFLFGGVLYQVGDQLLGLRPVASDSFDEDRVGLDHLSFAVSSRQVLDDAAGLREVVAEGHEVGSHGADHVPFDVLPGREADAQLALGFIAPDEAIAFDIAGGVDGIATEFDRVAGEPLLDYTKGNVKARMRMVAQYALDLVCHSCVLVCVALTRRT